MPLTIVNPPSGLVGPGVLVRVQQSDIGPIPTDDFVEVTVNDAVTGLVVCAGNKSMAGLFDCFVTLGKVPIRTPFDWISRGLAAAAAASITARQFHANGTQVAFTSAGGYNWDPVSGLWLLMALPTSSSDAADIAAIKAAVIRTFPPP